MVSLKPLAELFWRTKEPWFHHLLC
jgi:hypothetical protein